MRNQDRIGRSTRRVGKDAHNIELRVFQHARSMAKDRCVRLVDGIGRLFAGQFATQSSTVRMGRSYMRRMFLIRNLIGQSVGSRGACTAIEASR